MLPEEGRSRVIIEGVTPEIDGGRFPIKRIVGDETVVEADILTDGHDALSCALLYRKESEAGVDRGAHGAAGQRPLARLVPGPGAGALPATPSRAGSITSRPGRATWTSASRPGKMYPSTC